MFEKFFMYPLLAHIIIHLSTFINYLKITLKVMLKQKSPIKGFWVVREMQECATVFISQEKDKEQSQKWKENMLLKT